MAESYTQEPGSAYGANYGHSANGRTRRIWLWLLLLVLVVVLFTYDQGAVMGYGEKAYSKTETLIAKVSRRAKDLYRCGLAGCKQTATGGAALAPAQPVKPEATVIDQSSVSPNSASNSAANAATSDLPTDQPTVAGDWTAAPSSTPAATSPSADSTGQTSGSGYPAYPPYPPYPAYPPYSAFGSSGADGAAGTSAAGNPSGSAPLSAPATQYVQIPPTPPTPEAAPGKPAYPDYPAYPPVAGYSRPTTPGHAAESAAPLIQPTPALKSPPQVQPTIRPDQRPGLTPADGLASARQAAMAGRLADSIQEYLQYLAKHPNDGDAYGELGNVYLKGKHFSEAAQNYYEAATRLIDAGHVEAVAPLMPIIERHEPMLATLIQQKIARSGSTYPR